MIDRTISHYRIVEKLGAGGMGVVYKAEDTKLARTVALKFFAAHLIDDAEAKQRFLREAQAAAGLNHPNICTVHEIDHADGETFIAMALVEGESLEARIARGPLPIPEALDICRQVAEGLQAAHDRGVVHRDIKPANVLIDTKGHATIVDFGLALLRETSRLTKAHATMGTAAYMSPEQVQGLDVDHRSDIWAVGGLLYEAVCGQRPFNGQYEQALFYEIVNEEPEPLTGLRAGVPIELDWIVGKALAKKAEQRYQRAHELALDLANLSEKLRSGRAPVVAKGGAEKPDPTPSARTVLAEEPSAFHRNRWRWAAALVVLVAAALAAGLIYFPTAPTDTAVYQLTIDLPSGRPHSFSLSPDGRHIAIAMLGTGGEQRLWLRSMDSGQARELPETEGAGYPFWSPDSRHIAFFAQGKLRTIGLSGGPVQSLCDAEDGRGGSWGREGVIVFAPSIFGQLQRVPASGGEPVAITTSSESGPRAARRSPWFLPDGKHFLFTDGATAPDRAGIYLGSIEGMAPRRLLADESNAAYSGRGRGGSGFLLFVRENNLMARPFDARRLELVGDALPVAQSIGGTGARGSYGFSVSDSGDLAYIGGSGFFNFPQTQLAWLDRSGAQLQALGEPGSFNSLSLSPDDTEAAVGMGGPAGSDLWLLDTVRGAMSRLSTNPGNDLLPAWSPGGGRIAFTSDRAGQFGLFQMDPGEAGSEEPIRPKETFPFGAFVMDWSPNGEDLLFATLPPRTKFDLWSLPLAGDREPAPYQESEFWDTWACYSPNGRWVAYQSDESGRYEIYVRPFPTGSGKRAISTHGGSAPIWGADGRAIYFIEPDLTLTAVDVEFGDRVEAGPPRPLFRTRLPLWPGVGTVARLYDVSRDGSRFLIANRLGDGRDEEAMSLTIILNWQGRAAR